jgi:hypothetical protein
MEHKRYTAHTIMATVFEEAALAAVVLWLLPRRMTLLTSHMGRANHERKVDTLLEEY